MDISQKFNRSKRLFLSSDEQNTSNLYWVVSADKVVKDDGKVDHWLDGEIGLQKGSSRSFNLWVASEDGKSFKTDEVDLLIEQLKEFKQALKDAEDAVA